MRPTDHSSSHARRRPAGRGPFRVLAVALSLAAAAAIALVSVPGQATAATGHPQYSDGHPRDARITIRAIGIHRLPVIAYRGKTDDGPGTRIQNRGIAASPYGRQGGIGPGGIGNYQVTAHRTSHGGVFNRVPSLDPGDKVLVDAGRWRYVYRITRTRWVSFRSAKSLRAQRAEVPGKPGRTAHRGYITISTCATPEDHARGNYWTDRYGNPEHRIDKIGVLVRRVANPHFHPRHR
jgi:sortase A